MDVGATIEHGSSALGFIGEGTTSPKLKALVGPYIVMVVGLNVILTLLAGMSRYTHII